MPSHQRKRRRMADSDEEEESEWEEGASSEVSKDHVLSDEDDDRKPAALPDRSTSTSTQRRADNRVRALRRVDFSSGEEEEVPTVERLTERGGYIHTKGSRMKISKANRGNTPWNKGKNRSEEVKAKISAGVKARNRAILLKQLEKIGVSEEEWLRKKKEIKYFREVLRKSKLTLKAKEEESKQKHAVVAIKMNSGDEEEAEEEEENDSGSDGYSEESEAGEDKDHEEQGDEGNDETDVQDEIGVQDETGVQDEPDEEVVQGPARSIFGRDVKWSAHPFDSADVSYDTSCPQGGPGGLICCTACMANYSKYLSTTYKDIEEQKTAKIGEELTELLQFTEDAKSRLSQTIRVARRKPVPVPGRNKFPESTSTLERQRGSGQDPEDWTSAVDISSASG